MFAAERATQATDKFRGERLQNEAVLLLEKSDLGARVIGYLRRSFEGMTNWPFVVTVETSVSLGSSGDSRKVIPE